MQVGSWLQQQIGADYGTRGLLEAIESESFSDGGVFVYERAPIRHMSFPLIVGSGAGLSLSLVQIESLLRFNARPGGYIDVQPEGVASSDAVRFDIVHGRWEPEYSIYHQRLPRRQGTLLLDTQPYGYWPTWVNLVAGASVMSPGRVLLKGASVIGDAPAFARFVVQPVGAAGNPSAGTSDSGISDFAAWSIAGGPSVPSVLAAPSWTLPGVLHQGMTFTGASDFSASTIMGRSGILAMTVAPTAAVRPFGWHTPARPQLRWIVQNGVMGRFHVFGWMRLWGASGNPVYVTMDSVGASFNGPLASAMPIATLLDSASMAVSSYINASGIGYPWQLVDFGEVTIPAPGHATSYPSYNWALRFWLSAPSLASVSGWTQHVDFAGVWLQPLPDPGGGYGGGAGYVPAYLAQPSAGALNVAGQSFAADGKARQFTFRQKGGAIASPGLFDAVEGYPMVGLYNGGFPLLGATDTLFNVLVEERKTGDTTAPTWAIPLARYTGEQALVTVDFQPRFQFLKGL